MHLQFSLTIASLLLVGCATNATVSPSQNSSLQAVSPNIAASSQGGVMQRSLDTWLKDAWTPLTTPKETETKEEAIKHTQGAFTASKTENEKPFALQNFADKWKVYHENKEKREEGKPKEASHIETLQKMPVIGK